MQILIPETDNHSRSTERNYQFLGLLRRGEADASVDRSVYKTRRGQISSPRFSVSDREWSCSGLIKSISVFVYARLQWSFAHDELLAITYHLLFSEKQDGEGVEILWKIRCKDASLYNPQQPARHDHNPISH